MIYTSVLENYELDNQIDALLNEQFEDIDYINESIKDVVSSISQRISKVIEKINDFIKNIIEKIKKFFNEKYLDKYYNQKLNKEITLPCKITVYDIKEIYRNIWQFVASPTGSSLNNMNDTLFEKIKRYFYSSNEIDEETLSKFNKTADDIRSRINDYSHQITNFKSSNNMFKKHKKEIKIYTQEDKDNFIYDFNNKTKKDLLESIDYIKIYQDETRKYKKEYDKFRDLVTDNNSYKLGNVLLTVVVNCLDIERICMSYLNLASTMNFIIIEKI
jgi:cell shape-determining protein MreC